MFDQIFNVFSQPSNMFAAIPYITDTASWIEKNDTKRNVVPNIKAWVEKPSSEVDKEEISDFSIVHEMWWGVMFLNEYIRAVHF